MKDYFQSLRLPLSLSLEPTEIESAWREATKSIPTESDATDFNRAREVLSHPSSRLDHWISLRAPELSPNRAISPELMDLFSEISPTIAAADDVLSRHEKATTSLTRALLTKEAITSQIALQNLLGRIQALKTNVIDQFPSYEESAESGDYTAALQGSGQLKFLQKWEQQCQERLLGLISCG